MVSAPAAACGITSLSRHLPKSSSARAAMPTGIGICLVLAAWLGVLAMESPVCAGETAFDTVYLRDRSKSVGIYLGRDVQHAFFAMRRQIAEGSKGWIQTYRKKADEEERVAYEQLRVRTQAMLQEPNHDTYRFILEQESERASQWLRSEEHARSDLVILSIPLDNVAKWELAGRDSHALALWAWRKQIDAPETAAPEKLKEWLQQANVDWKLSAPDLGSQFQAIPQNGDEWRARLALVRYSRDREIEFQGTAGMMVRIGDRNAQADVAKLLAQGVQQQSQQLLGELLNGAKPKQASKQAHWLESCQEMLKEDREDYFRASCMEQGIARSDGTVESVFMVRFGNDWKPIWKATARIDIQAVPNATRKQVENDPQIQSLLALAESLGVGSQEMVDQAIKMGAATMQAQSQIDQQFEFFRQRFQHRLDIPVLRWDITPPERRPGR